MGECRRGSRQGRARPRDRRGGDGTLVGFRHGGGGRDGAGRNAGSGPFEGLRQAVRCGTRGCVLVPRSDHPAQRGHDRLRDPRRTGVRRCDVYCRHRSRHLPRARDDGADHVLRAQTQVPAHGRGLQLAQRFRADATLVHRVHDARHRDRRHHRRRLHGDRGRGNRRRLRVADRVLRDPKAASFGPACGAAQRRHRERDRRRPHCVRLSGHLPADRRNGRRADRRVAALAHDQSADVHVHRAAPADLRRHGDGRSRRSTASIRCISVFCS